MKQIRKKTIKEGVFHLKKAFLDWKKLLKFQNPQLKRTVKKLTFLALPLVFLASIYVWQNYNGSIGKEMEKLKLLPEAEHFTELYFQNYKDLPQNVTAGQTVSFSFAVRNLEGEDQGYKYSVYFESDGSRAPIDSGEVMIKDNETQTIDEVYIFKDNDKKGKVVVELPDKNQHIHFQLIPLAQLIEIANINW